MNHLLNLLKAFGIVIGWYCLLFTGIRAMLYLCGIAVWPADGPVVFIVPLILISLFLVTLTFGALYLPPQGRLYAAMAMLLLTLAIWISIGINIFNALHH